MVYFSYRGEAIKTETDERTEGTIYTSTSKDNGGIRTKF